MSESILKALIKLFAIIGTADENSAHSRYVVELFLKQMLSTEQLGKFLQLYDEFVKQQNEGVDGEKKKRRLAVNSVKVIVICEQINEELNQKQKFIVLVNLIEFICSNGEPTLLETEFIETVASYFNISEEELAHCISLSKIKNSDQIIDSENFLLISNLVREDNLKYHHVRSLHLDGELIIYQLKSIGIYLFKYLGEGELFLNGQLILQNRIYILAQGASIRNSKIETIYYSDIISSFLIHDVDQKILYQIHKIQFQFSNGKIGLHPINFSATSGKLIGIMGGSGAGKSTLLNILNGNSKPSAGEVLINGLNLHEEKSKLKGVIGYIPQDDLLIEDLTVYQNLYFNAKLCFGNSDELKIINLVEATLLDLGLSETKNLIVGNSLDNTISGGQRKRLNIALELIREPSVLFVDEPTSGLSSRDSENIMDLLKELALKGKLVFVVIHQPSSDIFKMFDKLLVLDIGGYPIYKGNPTESVIYFKKLIQHVNANESECLSCGNVNPEQIFNIIEAKVIDENGNLTTSRRISPAEWNSYYLKNEQSSAIEVQLKETSPTFSQIKTIGTKPNLLKQISVFISRDVLAKANNLQYLLINVFEAPLLALILAGLIKYCRDGVHYNFSENKNLPAYLFMSVIVALFIGLTVSAEEIIRDRKILKRESFLNLSKSSYLVSKISILFFISAVQTLLFVLIGNYMLEINGMYFKYWLILFSTSCFANMLGLNISSAFNSVVSIYILIPFLLIPQMLLSGVIVKFEDLNPFLSTRAVVPITGEIMASRWAFEALAVNQFINNPYEKQIYNLEKELSFAFIKKVYWYGKMNELLENVIDSSKNQEILINEINKEIGLTPSIKISNINELIKRPLLKSQLVEIKNYLTAIKMHYSKVYDDANKQKDDWINDQQKDSKATTQFLELKNSNENEKIVQLLKNKDSELDPIVEEEKALIIISDPIFRDANASCFLRAHFFAPRKSIFGKFYDTYWVNVLVLWSMSLFLGLTLYFDLLKKILLFKFKR